MVLCCMILAIRRTVAVLCMLYKIVFNPMHHLNCALPVPYVPVWVTRCAVIAHRYTNTYFRCSPAISQDFLCLVSISVEPS